MGLHPRRRIVRAAGSSTMELVTIPNVELLEVGMDWETSTGIFTFTEDDILSAVNAMSDPSVRTPVAKLGHTDPRFDGDFSIGRFDNLRTTNNNQTLLSDWVGVPRWFAEIAPAAFPRRSIEGRYDWETYTGNRWPFYLTAVALLGAQYPAIATLEDIRKFWAGEPVQWVDVAASEDPPYSVHTERGIVMRADRVDAGADDRMKWSKRVVEASVEVSDIVRAFYDSLEANQSWWWIRTVQVDPPQLIVDDDDGHLYRVGYTTSGDEVTFSEPVMVKVQYEDVDGKKAAATESWSSDATAVMYPTRDASRRATVSPRAAHATPEDTMNEAQKALIGLAADATDDQVTARLTELAASAGETEPAVPAPATTETPAETTTVEPAAPASAETPAVPEGMVLVDAAAFAEIKAGVADFRRGSAETETKRRKAVVDAAIQAGKFPRSRREHYDNLMASEDPKAVAATEALIAALEPGMIPVGVEHGTGEGDVVDGHTAEAYPAGWLPEVAARANGNTPTIVTEA